MTIFNYILLLFFLSYNLIAIAQSHQTIHLKSRSKINITDTLSSFINEPFNTKKKGTIKELEISLNDRLYFNLGTRIKINKKLNEDSLIINGANIYYYGVNNEFLIVPYTSPVIFEYKGKIISQKVLSNSVNNVQLYVNETLLDMNNSFIIFQAPNDSIEIRMNNNQDIEACKKLSDIDQMKGFYIIQNVRNSIGRKRVFFEGNKIPISSILQSTKLSYFVLYFTITHNFQKFNSDMLMPDILKSKK